MTRNGILSRTSRTTGVSVALAAVLTLAAACAPGPDAQPVQPPPTTSGSGAANAASGTPGHLSVRASGIDLTISDAVAHLNAAGTGDLTMIIRNGTGVPEHLAMVATPNGGRGTLQGGTDLNGSLATSGILLGPNSTTAFGTGSGPHVLLSKVTGISADHTLALTLQFGVAGLVHLRARVAGQ